MPTQGRRGATFSFGGAGKEAQTELGLRVGDPLGQAQNLYGSALTTSAAQGGSWSATTPDGFLRGYLSGVPGQQSLPYPQPLIESIGAGDVGCPAASPWSTYPSSAPHRAVRGAML